MESPVLRCDDDPPAVLVVYVNCAVAMALAARLVDQAIVTLAPLAGAIQTLKGNGRVDVVVLCPYLDTFERACVTATINSRRQPCPRVELVDIPHQAPARLKGPADQSAGEARALAQILGSLEA